MSTHQVNFRERSALGNDLILFKKNEPEDSNSTTIQCCPNVGLN